MTAGKLLLWIGVARVGLEFAERSKVSAIEVGPGPFGLAIGGLKQALVRSKFNRIQRGVDLAFLAVGLFVIGS